MVDQLKERADLGGSVDEAIATFAEVTCLVPRLKLDVILGYAPIFIPISLFTR
jgi:hypothetical protein